MHTKNEGKTFGVFPVEMQLQSVIQWFQNWPPFLKCQIVTCINLYNTDTTKSFPRGDNFLSERPISESRSIINIQMFICYCFLLEIKARDSTAFIRKSLFFVSLDPFTVITRFVPFTKHWHSRFMSHVQIRFCSN